MTYVYVYVYEYIITMAAYEIAYFSYWISMYWPLKIKIYKSSGHTTFVMLLLTYSISWVTYMNKSCPMASWDSKVSIRCTLLNLDGDCISSSDYYFAYCFINTVNLDIVLCSHKVVCVCRMGGGSRAPAPLRSDGKVPLRSGLRFLPRVGVFDMTIFDQNFSTICFFEEIS